MSLGPAEILVVLVLALIVFGPKRLPEVTRQVGGALRELRKVQDTVQTEIRSVLDDTTAPVRTMQPAAELQTPTETPPAAVEPDLGDERPRSTTDPSASSSSGSSTGAEDEPPAIDGLSGGTFS